MRRGLNDNLRIYFSFQWYQKVKYNDFARNSTICVCNIPFNISEWTILGHSE